MGAAAAAAWSAAIGGRWRCQFRRHWGGVLVRLAPLVLRVLRALLGRLMALAPLVRLVLRLVVCLALLALVGRVPVIIVGGLR